MEIDTFVLNKKDIAIPDERISLCEWLGGAISNNGSWIKREEKTKDNYGVAIAFRQLEGEFDRKN